MQDSSFVAAWMFLSIGDGGGCKGWTELGDVISMADSNNHAIPSAEELVGGVSDLVGCGYVEREGNSLRLSATGCSMYNEANGWRVGHIDRMLRLADRWRSASFPPPAAPSWPLSESDWLNGYQSNHEKFVAAVDNLAAKDPERWASFKGFLARRSRDIRQR